MSVEELPRDEARDLTIVAAGLAALIDRVTTIEQQVARLEERADNARDDIESIRSALGVSSVQFRRAAGRTT